MPKWIVKVSAKIDADGQIEVQANRATVNGQGDLILSVDPNADEIVLAIRADHWFSIQRA
jgi:hypothetical protein